jgi:NTP pyrophosphatase (non-canonical NTP hydrolase)
VNGTLTIRALQVEAHRTAQEHGWWDDARTDLECLALVHSEISEAVEALRDGSPSFYVNALEVGKPEGVAVELADAVIRIADLCEARGFDLEAAIVAKLAFNRTRPYRHGGKRA